MYLLITKHITAKIKSLSEKYSSVKMKLFSIFILIFLFGFGQDNQPTLYLIGDSTMADKEKLYLPERGWGQLLPQFFTGNISIENHARNGRSTRSFIYEGRWDSICQKLQPGDFVIIQFGHNDGSIQKTDRYTTVNEYEYNLRKFVRETLDKKAHPVLATPVVRRRFDDQGQFRDSHGEYPDVVRKIAADMQIPLLDMHKKSLEYVSSLGPDASMPVYLHLEPRENDSLPDGKHDDTHFSEFGALEMAKIAVAEIKLNVPELAIHLKP
jgi:lysophospholipase L1-like esterase